MIRKIIISDGRLVTWCILHGPASCHHILFTAPEEGFLHSVRPVCDILTILSFFSTCSSPYLSFLWKSLSMCATIPLVAWEVPPEWQQKCPNEQGWMSPAGPLGSIPLYFPHPPLPLPRISQAPSTGGLCGSINLSAWIRTLQQFSRALLHHKLQWKHEILFSLVCVTQW